MPTHHHSPIFMLFCNSVMYIWPLEACYLMHGSGYVTINGISSSSLLLGLHLDLPLWILPLHIYPKTYLKWWFGMMCI